MADDVFYVVKQSLLGFLVGARVFIGLIDFLQVADLSSE